MLLFNISLMVLHFMFSYLNCSRYVIHKPLDNHFYGLRIIKLFFMLITILVIWLIKSWSYIQVLISLKDNRNWFIQFTKLFNLTIIVIICINSCWKVLEMYITLNGVHWSTNYPSDLPFKRAQWLWPVFNYILYQ